MKTKHLCRMRCAIVTIGVLGAALLRTSAAHAFDTGHHADLSRSALQEEGFNNTSIKVVQLDNWLVDYYSNTKTDILKPSIAVVKDDSDKLHFDNLYSTEQVSNYWGHLARNARRAIQDAAKQNDPLQGITLLGVSLHAVQDFYTHSNWVETHPRTGSNYRTDTFFDAPPGNGVDLFTGYYPNQPKPSAGREPHGEYGNGLNHDSYVRSRWDEAYVYAYVASRQWTQAMHAWVNEVNPNFWTQMQNLSASRSDAADLERDLNASYRISEWVSVGGNGHWKGNGSGSSEFLPFAVNWARQSDSIYVKEYKDKRVYAPLIEGLVNNNALRDGKQISKAEGDAPVVPRAQFSQRVIIVRTLRVEELPVGTFELKIDSGGKADFFGKVTVAGQPFVEAMQMDQSSVNPRWTTMRFLPNNSPVSISYQLWDEDGGASGDDDRCDINPARGRADLNFTFDINSHRLSGDLNGVHDTVGNAVTSEGAKPDKDRARLRFFVTAVPLAPADR